MAEILKFEVPQKSESASGEGNLHQSDRLKYNLALLEKSPNHLGALSGSARIYYLHGDFEKAKELFLRLTKLVPQNAPTWYNLGMAYSHLEELDFARDAFFEYAKLQKDHKFLNDLGNTYYHIGKFDYAVDAFETVLKYEPHNTDAWIGFDMVCHAAGDLIFAEKYFLKASEIKPSYLAALNSFGVFCCKLGKFDLAADAFLNALENDPQNAVMLRNLGHSYSNLGKFNLAADAFLKALENDPQNIYTWVELAMVYKNLNKKSLAQACLKKVSEIEPKYHLKYLKNAFEEITNTEKSGGVKQWLCGVFNKLIKVPNQDSNQVHIAVPPVSNKMSQKHELK